MPRPIVRQFDTRACGASLLWPPQSSVFISFRLGVVLGTMDSHGGIAIQASGGSSGVFFENLPVVVVGDINDVCRWIPWPGTHYAMPAVTGDKGAFI